MTVFDLPRIHFGGRLRLNPATANNEDYAQPGPNQARMPHMFPDFEGQPMGLLTSSSVQVREFGLPDADFVEWIQRSHHFESPSGAQESVIPAEWNYYGDMSSTAVDIEVIGVQTRFGSVHQGHDVSIPLTDVIGATLSFTGNITDVNPEGSPPATQFFIDNLLLERGETSYISGGTTTKGVGTWINFFRNVNLFADDGAGTALQHVICDAELALPGFEDADGVVLSYYLSLPLLDDRTASATKVLEQYFRDRRSNPKTLDMVGTLAPFYEGEPIAMPPGRQLISRQQNIPTSPKTVNNGGGNGIALAPAVASQSGNWLTINLSGTLPDAFIGPDRQNAKFDFGALSLHVANEQEDIVVGDAEYANVAAGDARGWLYDFELTTAAAEMLADGGKLVLRNDRHGTVLEEVDYYVVTDQLAVYGEQFGPTDVFVSQGTREPMSVSVFHRGDRLDPATCPPISMWEYRSSPIQAPGDAVRRTDSLRPGESISMSTERAGSSLLTFHVEGETNPPAGDFPPESYSDFAYPSNAFVVTWAPQISVRVLPNADYSHFYLDPTADEPVGNDALTWDVVYSEVLRTYALLYPAMSNKFRLDDEAAMTRFAPYVIEATRPENWHSSRYMPPTRDLSESRRTLLQAWCRKVMALAT